MFCIAEVPSGGNSSSATFDLIVEPHWISVEPGTPVRFACTLQCRAKDGAVCDLPPVVIDWRSESGSLNPEATIRNGVLNFPSAMASDEQYYYCSATSDVLSLETKTILFVRNRSE